MFSSDPRIEFQQDGNVIGRLGHLPSGFICLAFSVFFGYCSRMWLTRSTTQMKMSEFNYIEPLFVLFGLIIGGIALWLFVMAAQNLLIVCRILRVDSVTIEGDVERNKPI